MASGAAPLPSGTVTFLLTDVKDSVALWERHPEGMRAALARHDALIEQLVTDHFGVVVRPRGEGDSRFAVFTSAWDGVAAACAVQRALLREPWPMPEPAQVRMAVHTGDSDLRDGDYYGSAVNRCARLRGLAHGGQVVLSEMTVKLLGARYPFDGTVRELGTFVLRGLAAPERVFQLVHPDLPRDFPATARDARAAAWSSSGAGLDDHWPRSRAGGPE